MVRNSLNKVPCYLALENAANSCINSLDKKDKVAQDNNARIKKMFKLMLVFGKPFSNIIMFVSAKTIACGDYELVSFSSKKDKNAETKDIDD